MVKRRTARRQAVSRKVEAIEPRNTIKQGKDDAVWIAEINTKPAYEGESVELPRGHRAWHVGHCEHVGTREALKPLAWMRVCRTIDNKGRKANRYRGVGWRYSTDEGG